MGDRLLLADRRIALDARPVPELTPVLDVVMLGHCPGRVEWERLAGDARLCREIAALGLQAEVGRLQARLAGPGPAPIAEDDGDPRNLYRLPLPLYSFAQFQALFPEAFDTATGYRSRLAGDRAWLPLAVQDFFAGDDDAGPLADGARRLWVIRVPESGRQAAMLPEIGADLGDPERLGAFERALLIPDAGILALPDLERLQVPADLPDVPRVRLPNPDPAFLPCGEEIDDGHRERRYGVEIPRQPAPLVPERVIPPILRALARHRPDLQCLLALPFAPQARGEMPVPSRETLDLIGHLAQGAPGPRFPAGAGGLRQIQFLYPYLRGRDRRLGSPGGPVAGLIAATSQRRGPWRSVAGRPLPGAALPDPPVGPPCIAALREDPGIGILARRGAHAELDDERLAGPVFDDRALGTAAGEGHYRSGELMRLLGWLRRELAALGERLVFDIDPRDPRPAMALEDFLTRLHERGALRGARPEQAFSVRRLEAGEARLAFEIEIAPALPIDRLRLSFVHDRDAGGPPRLELAPDLARGDGGG